MPRASLAFLFLLAASPLTWGQDPGSTQQQQPPPTVQNSSSESSAKKEKKVWTNENLSDAKGSVSVVGGRSAGKAKGPAGKTPDGAYIAKVRKDLEKLRADIAAADVQIAKLRDFNAGEPVGTSEREFHKGYNMQPVDQQIRGLEAKKKQLQAKIDALLDEAREKGVEPGQLR
jgi:hypothetical protein